MAAVVEQSKKDASSTYIQTPPASRRKLRLDALAFIWSGYGVIGNICGAELAGQRYIKETINLKYWKQHEQTISNLLNREHPPVADQDSTASVEHWLFSIEVKTRNTLPHWLHQDMAQAVKHDRSKMPLLVLHEKGMRATSDYAVVPMESMLTLLEAYERDAYTKTTQPDMYDRLFDDN